MRHKVHVHDPPPLVVRSVDAARDGDARVGAKQVDSAELLLNFSDNTADVGFIGYVGFSAAKRSHIARPIPRAPPVTMMTLSLSCIVGSRSLQVDLTAQINRARYERLLDSPC